MAQTRGPLSIAVAQPELRSFDVAFNAARHAEAVLTAGARVVVFPELSLTGYELAAEPVAVDDARLQPIADACSVAGAIAIAGAPVAGEDGNVYIGFVAFDGSATWIAYRKMWLGAAEAERFTAGPAPAVLEVDGWRLGLAICKDTGVPKHAADTAALGIDAYMAGTVKKVDEGDLQHERGRTVAAEHGIWVAIASFAGSTGGGFDPAAGRSAIWSPGGAVVAEAGTIPGGLARAAMESVLSQA